MKNILKTTFFAALAVSFIMVFVLSAKAQRPGSGSSSSSPKSSGGGGNSGGGGSRPPASSNVSPSRPSGMPSPSRVGSSYQGQNQGNINRQQGNGVNRGGYQYNPRQPNPNIQNNQRNSNSQNNSPRTNYGFPQRTGVNTNAGQVGFNNYPQRVGVSSSVNSGYRVDGPKAYEKNDYWANNGYNHHNHGYYNTYYEPRIGFSCTVLPYGYYPFFWGDYQYYYSDGLFYEYANDEYTVVEPPVGAEVTTLPSNASSIVINGQQYYEAGGVYYQPYTKDDGTLVYVVAGKDGELNTTPVVQSDEPKAPQMGDMVNQLPPNCRKINVNGQKLFVSVDGIYYQEIAGANNTVSYKIVGLPEEDPNQN